MDERWERLSNCSQEVSEDVIVKHYVANGCVNILWLFIQAQPVNGKSSASSCTQSFPNGIDVYVTCLTNQCNAWIKKV